MNLESHREREVDCDGLIPPDDLEPLIRTRNHSFRSILSLSMKLASYSRDANSM